MKKYSGIHFYVNINNLNKIIRKDEVTHDDIRRTFHALNTYTMALEKFANETNIIEIEKFTTSRYHFYIQCSSDEKESDISALIDLIVFSKTLAQELTKINKYQALSEFQIGIGADFGIYTEFNFTDPNSEIEEMTTIGSPANRAAKLQSEAENNEVLISKDLYDILPLDKKSLFYGDGTLSAKLAVKYTELTVYSSNISELKKTVSDAYRAKEEHCLDYAKDNANAMNLSDITFSESTANIDYSVLSLKNSKWKDNAAVLFSDIRGFTQKVDNEDLSEIKQLTQTVLSKMNTAIRNEFGVHVQFQGDRESAIFVPYRDETNNNIMRCVFAAMRMIDDVNILNQSRAVNKLNIGIGCALGTIFTTRIGMKGRKFNVVMGETVKTADFAEDNVAGARVDGAQTEIALTSAFYNELQKIDNIHSRQILKQLSKRTVTGRDFYICTIGYKQFKDNLDICLQDNNASKAKHNGGIRPWGI